jgi:hypothetical protein
VRRRLASWALMVSCFTVTPPCASLLFSMKALLCGE